MKELKKAIKKYGGKLNYRSRDIAVILAAGHGKRIKSETPKVVHPVWGVPSVIRLSRAVSEGLNSDNQIMVVGIKADEVIELIGKHPHTQFAYQKVQKGTGHAVQEALSVIKNRSYNGNIYSFPGDAGLLDRETIHTFKKAFISGSYDMMMLTGTYEGPPELNYYGRILRVPENDVNGRYSGMDFNRVIAIVQYRDILGMTSRKPLAVSFNGRKYSFTKKELLAINEFDSGCFAFKYRQLKKHIFRVKTDNLQSEIYVTDLVSIFNRAGLKVGAIPAKDSNSLLAFNNKSTWKKMESLARAKYYEVLKDIIIIDDEEKFFLAEEVIRDILRMDRRIGPLDISMGANCHIAKDVRLNKGTIIGENVWISGKVVLGRNVRIGDNVHLSAYPGQTLRIGSDCEILGTNMIKGNTVISDKVRIETGVNITGSDDYPVRIGTGTLIKGTSYIFGTIIEPGNWIEHSILVNCRVKKTLKADGKIEKLRYFRPFPEGTGKVKSL